MMMITMLMLMINDDDDDDDDQDYDLRQKGNSTLQHDFTNYVVLTEMDPDEELPDCCFVEDPAVVLDGTAIISNMSQAARQGEVSCVFARGCSTRVHFGTNQNYVKMILTRI